MQKNHKSFIKSFYKYLESKAKAKPSFNGVKILSYHNEYDDKNLLGCLNINVNNKLYSLYFCHSKGNDNDASYLNLHDEDRAIINGKKKKSSFLQLTIKNNFFINENKFKIIQNRTSTISRKQVGMKEDFENKMFKAGFNKEKIILEGTFTNTDFDKIANDFFNWLTISIKVKSELEGEYTIEDELENIDDFNEYDGKEEIYSRTEGGVKVFISRKYERKSSNRSDALKIHGYKCVVCKFDFEDTYGGWGKGFAEVHHLEPLSKSGEKKRIINPQTDLAVVCANCHRMIHRKKGITLTIEELKVKFKKARLQKR